MLRVENKQRSDAVKECVGGGVGREVDFKVPGLEELLGKMLPFTGSWKMVN